MSATTANRHRRVATCLRCDRNRIIRARGLCESCFTYMSYKRQLDNWPLTITRSADFADDYRILSGRGLTLEQIAAKMGRPVTSVCSAVIHAVHRGHLPQRHARDAWLVKARGRQHGPLAVREQRLLTHYATCANPNPLREFGIAPGTLRAYKFSIRRKLGVEAWDDAVRAFVAEAVLSC